MNGRTALRWVRRAGPGGRSVGAEPGVPAPTYLTVAHLRAEKRGSLEDQLIYWAGLLRARGQSPSFLFSADPMPSVSDDLAGRGADVGILDFDRPLAAAAGLYRLIPSRRVPRGHFHLVRPRQPVLLAARAAGARVMITDHIVLGGMAGVDNRQSTALPLTAWRSGLRWAGAQMAQLAELRLAVSDAVAASLVREERVALPRIRGGRHGV